DDDDESTPTPTPQIKSARFVGMPAPTASSPAELASTSVKSELVLELTDGSTVNYKLAYQPFFMTGDMVPDGNGGEILAGGYYDINNQPLMDTSVPGDISQFYSDCPDGTSFLTVDGAKVDGVKGNTVFAVVQFEYKSKAKDGSSTYGALPSPIAVLTLDQDPETGKLTLVKYHNVDTSKVHGLWITCGASLSPWGTHLSSEEYEPDAFDMNQGGQSLSTLKAYSKFTYGNENSANPYNYCHLPEIVVNPDGTGTAKKHYCLGRISHELVQVMPDQRTVLMGDDYTNGGLFMFVADKEADLSAGTLYVAKYTSVLSDQSVDQATAGKIQWIKLGHATSDEISALVNTDNIQPTDIMDVVNAATAPDGTYTSVTLNKTQRWVKLANDSDRTHKAAAFLETHRYAALRGGSMAFTKMEGTTVNAKDKIAYSAIANLTDSMIVGLSGYVAEHNVHFPKKVNAGCVLQHFLGGGMVDSDGNAINSEWAPQSTAVLIAGEDLPSGTADGLGNTSNPDLIASADNLKFSEQLRTLFIGEDSGNHLNNFLWAYNVDTKSLDRLLSCPAGAESTGLHAVDEINGWTYIASNFQHAGDEWARYMNKADEAGSSITTGGLPAALMTQIDEAIDENFKDKNGAYVGYLTADVSAIKLK
ncbi:PhoX family protein, partial [Bordetella tumbae]|uniref:PhoX family protein n=1 Tax=Bordetella tumbae TaxID=1649139 RepID=UPI0039F1059E